MHHTSHAYMATFVPEASVSLVAFNLGYLPGTDRSIVTAHDSTLVALQASMQVWQSPHHSAWLHTSSQLHCQHAVNAGQRRLLTLAARPFAH